MPLGSVAAVVMLTVAGAIVMANCFDAGVPAPSLTWTVKPDVPAAVGVPAIVPPFSETPAGSDPDAIDHV